MDDSSRFPVVVVGSGNAGFCAALAARDAGAPVLLLEKADENWAGGNSYFTAGAIRTTHAGVDDLRPLLAHGDDERLDCTDLAPYTPDDFRADMLRVTAGRTDPALLRVLVDEIAPAMRWLHGKGIAFRLMYDRQSFEVNGRYGFWGGLALGTVDGGKGLVAGLRQAAVRAGVDVRFGAPVSDLVAEAGRVVGVEVDGERIDASAVVLASGGFEADPQLRAAHLGPGWDLAKVRGTPHNTGELLMRALEHGAQSTGHWSGCHSTAWDAGAPVSGDRELTNLYTKQSYPIGIVVNAAGQRFVDEGADFRNYTYAKYGAEILRQPGALAYQLYDAQTVGLLRQDEYTAPGVSRHEEETIAGLERALDIPEGALQRTVSEFNAAITTDVPFNPAVKDGRRTIGLALPKSNWALALEQPPFVAFAVTCGITYTFGGLRIDTDARVIDRAGRPIPGLYAAGEIASGLFFHNYPGGSGLAAGAVFGRRAGHGAAAS